MSDNRSTQQAMKERCEEQGHEWENGMTLLFQVIRICKWCGKEEGRYGR